jgi:hypothetical protein
LSIDPNTGQFFQVATGFNNPIDVRTDPEGNLLVAAFGGGGRIYRLDLVNDAGDYNNDNAVDAADYVAWRKMLGQTGFDMLADGNGNNEIDDMDYGIWSSRFGSTVEAGLSSTVPEPSVFSILIGIIGYGMMHGSPRGRMIIRGRRGNA